MKIKASGRSALIIATGLFLCFATPSQAAEGADDATPGVETETAGAPLALHNHARHGARRGKKHTQRQSSKVAHKSTDKKSDEAAADDGGHATAMPPSVADANAELPSADTATPDARARSTRANNILQTAPSTPPEAQPAPQTDMVSADQLNDVDRTLHESAPAVPAVADTPAPAPAPAPVKRVAASSADTSAWDQTSLIGKIFIGFGVLLTVASAARMFMT